MTAKLDIAVVRANWPTRPGSTHYDGCEDSHYICQIHALCDKIARLEAVAAAAAAFIHAEDHEGPLRAATGCRDLRAALARLD